MVLASIPDPPLHRASLLMARAGRITGWIAVALVGLAVLLGGAFLFLTRTQAGMDVVLDQALRVLRGSVDGEVEVAGIRSRRLLDGFVLDGVVIRGPEGRPFVEVDSVAVRYAALSFLAGDIVLDRVELWRPRVHLEPGPDGRLNALSIFRVAEEPAVEAPESPRGIALRGVTIHDGLLEVRVPVEDAGEDGGVRAGVEDRPPPPPLTIPTEDLPGLGRVLSMSFREVQGEIPEVVLQDPDLEGIRVVVSRLALDGHVFQAPFHLQELRGELAVVRDSLFLEAERIWFPGSELSGELRLALGGEEFGMEARVDAPVLRLEDFRWVDPALPEGSGTASATVRVAEGETHIGVAGVDLTAGESRISGEGEVSLDGSPGGVRLVGVDVEARPLATGLMERWLLEPLPLDGLVTGRLRASGGLDALQVAGRLGFRVRDAAQRRIESEVTGTLHLVEPFGATGLQVAVGTLDFGLLGEVIPGFRLQGPGTASLELSGRYGGRMAVSARVTHSPEGFPESIIRLAGGVTGAGEGLALEMEGGLEPLSLTAIARDYPELPIIGELEGRLALTGPIRALRVDTALESPGGLITAGAVLDLLDLDREYSLDAAVDDFRLAELLPGLPRGTRVTARMELEGTGLTAETIQASGRLVLGPSWFGEIPLDGGRVDARILARRLTLDTLSLQGPSASLEGRGSLGLNETGPEGELVAEYRVASLEPFRPLLLPGATIAADTLSPLEVELLRMEGIDPDTLPTLAQIALDGSLSGSIRAVGTLRAMTVEGTADGRDLVYRSNRVAATEVSFLVEGLPEGLRGLDVTLDARELEALGRTFLQLEGRVVSRGETGSVDLRLQQEDREGMTLHSSLAILPGGGGRAEVDEFTLFFQDDSWVLQRPALVAWDSARVEVRDLLVTRPEPGGVRIAASGYIPLGTGEADFSLDVEGMDLARLVTLAQLEGEAQGVTALQARITGDAAAPVIEATVSGRDLLYAAFPVSRVEGTLNFQDRRLSTRFRAWEGNQEALELDLEIPANLAFREVSERFPDEAIRGSLRIRDFPAAIALSFLEVLEEVQGTLSGDVVLGGTLREPSPTGSLTVSGGAFTLEELGVRYRGIHAQAEVQEDRIIQVEGEARAGGLARFNGFVSLRELVDPAFDLSFTAAGFQVADRRDLQGRGGGSVRLSGSFRRPMVTGEVRVEQGVLFLDEFIRSATVVDLSDPSFFDVVDTTLIAVRPILEQSQNPFIQNLRMDVAVTVERDTWLRSRELNVEIAGELAVLFDRPTREIVLVGTLEAVRGSYNGFGRRFEVQEGTVEFMGTPGVNPRMNIRTATRLRTTDEILNIVATMEGTLLEPRITLGSDSEPPLPQSELASYLIFGRPSPFLSAGELSIVESATGAVSSLGLGVVANQLGAAVAQQVGLDYLAITTPTDADFLGAGSGFRGSVAATQFELGQYIAEDVFVALLLRPLSSLGSSGQNQFSGARVEWRFADFWTAMGFVEDRFSREPISGFRELGFSTAKAMGLLLYRDWSY